MIETADSDRPPAATATGLKRVVRLLIACLALLAIVLVVTTSSAVAAPVDCSAVTYDGSGTSADALAGLDT
ncbi:MAG: hypothetical protein U5K37_08805 [Natrialbaceae archaeon]|nr:hypothetical protein [Natrialbaceae archaeon]